MAQENRVFGKDVTVLSVNGLSLLARFVSISRSIQVEQAENRACKDYYGYPQPIGETSEITLEEAVEDVATARDGLMTQQGQSVIINYTPMTGGTLRSARYLIGSGEHAIRREGQNITIRATRQGDDIS